MAGFFGFFDYTKPGKGVSKDDVQKTGISLYLDIFMRRFWKFVTLNLIFLVVSIPAIVIAFRISVFAVSYLATLAKMEMTSEIITSLQFVGIMMTAIVLQLCGSGPASAGMSYVLRKYVNDTHSWVLSDFFDNFKSNFKQSLGVYLINIVGLCIYGVCFVFYSYAMPGMAGMFLRTVITVVAVVFAMMQMYTYQLMVSFELKFKDIYRNAFFLVMAKLPWNVLVAAVSAFLTYGALNLAQSIPLAAILVVATLFYSVINFTQIFMTNNVIKKMLLEPAIAASPTVEEEVIEPDFEDVKG